MKFIKFFVLLLLIGAVTGCDKNNDSSLTFKTGELDYQWDIQKTGTGSYALKFASGDDSNGMELILECFSKYYEDALESGTYGMHTGTYNLAETGEEFTFSEGNLNKYNNGERMGLRITGGSFYLYQILGTYSFSFKLVLENGENFKGSYAGSMSNLYRSNITSDVVTSVFNEGEATISKHGDNAWVIKMSKNFGSVTESVSLMLYTEGTETNLPQGSYLIASGILQGVKNTVEPASVHEKDGILGTWYSRQSEVVTYTSYAAPEGDNLNISKRGYVNVSEINGIYDIQFSFTNLYGHTVSGSYDEPGGWVDGKE